MLIDPANTTFKKAVAFVNQTNRHLFLTGKAGTGKTTFLKYIKEHSTKKMAVVAPTGVAAINAGGVTIHSFFQLPLGSFIPSQSNNWQTYDGSINNISSLFKNMRMTNARRDLLRELDVLVIDEVSMVRADVLDMIDVVFRHFRRQPLVPFGGVQMLYIGDLFQLPPVVKRDEWNVLRQYYKSPFFFDAQVLQHAAPVFIELKKIYRQTDNTFINILNNIRNNCCTENDLHQLHRHYKPGYEPTKEENYITLTSHNAKADTLNETELRKLPAKLHTYEATITGEFYENSYPVEKIISLKEGAQIMFIKNDKGEVRRYYNGKIGTIKKIDSEKILVSFPNENIEHELEREIWKNLRYNYNRQSDTIEEEELGTFTQYPVRLAWAITIHKSQGLTFDKAIIDAGASFAPGQVYVALSRLTTMGGLVLYSRIQPHCISTDPRVLEFVKNEMQEDTLQQMLEQEQKIYVRYMLAQSFNWYKMTEAINLHYDNYEHRQVPDKNKCIEWAKNLVNVVGNQQSIANTFTKKLEWLFAYCEADGYNKLLERTEAASGYFIKEIDEQLLNSLKKHIDEIKNKSKIKKYLKELEGLKLLIERKKQQVQEALQIAKALHQSVNMNELLQLVEAQQKPKAIQITETPADLKKREKMAKGDTQRVSLQMFKEGKAVSEIAAIRNLAQGTIEGHLAIFITSGEVDILELVSKENLKAIEKMINENPESLSSEIREKSGNKFSYGEIRAVMNWREWQSLKAEI
ncbi:MAG: helix-turn-helix domain-containing protein [Segetibacter sp.]|nr:helix-turn-helix domain-containing protein [Segetibacter sp.]